MTFQQRVAALPVTYTKYTRRIHGWSYNTRKGSAIHLVTGERFVGEWEVFLIEKRIIDSLNCDYEYNLLIHSM